MRIRNLMDKKLWPIDFCLIVYFIYLTIFNKPHWCIIRDNNMTEDCSEDIYGNGYYLWTPFPFIESGTFLVSTAIILYFNVKYYIIYKNMRQNINILSSARKTKLVLISMLNLLHFMFYFLTKDKIITIDGCSIIKVFFLLIVM